MNLTGKDYEAAADRFAHEAEAWRCEANDRHYGEWARLMAEKYEARAARFRAAAEAVEKLPPLNDRTIEYLAQTMEREGKRDGDVLRDV